MKKKMVFLWATLFYRVGWSEKKFCMLLRGQGYQYKFVPRKWPLIVAYFLLMPLWVPFGFIYMMGISVSLLRDATKKVRGPFSSMEMEVKNNWEARRNF